MQADDRIRKVLDALRQIEARRIILMGAGDDEDDDALRRWLVGSHRVVLEPPQASRAWLAALSHMDEVPQEESHQLRALVEDGAEHGVDALVVANKRLAHALEACGQTLPLIQV